MFSNIAELQSFDTVLVDNSTISTIKQKFYNLDRQLPFLGILKRLYFNIILKHSQIIKEKGFDIYYDTKGNLFSFEVIDQFSFTGKLYHGQSYGSIVVTDLKLVDRYTEKVIATLPDVLYEGQFDINEEDEELLFAELLVGMTEDSMKDYILKAIETYIETIC